LYDSTICHYVIQELFFSQRVVERAEICCWESLCFYYDVIQNVNKKPKLLEIVCEFTKVIPRDLANCLIIIC